MVNVQMVTDLALQRQRYKHLSDDEWRWLLQQHEGRLRTADKLPAFASMEDWWYPVRLSCEQCSSELTARYKTQILQSEGRSNSETVIQQSGQPAMADLTGGYGVDTFFLSELFAHTDYVEQNAELCRIVAHNKDVWQKVERQKLSIAIHNTTAEDFLLSSPCGEAGWGLIFLDPARRDSNGGKVFRLQDCTPNVIDLLPSLLQHLAPGGRIMLKLSPMIDITQALKELSAALGPSPLCHLSWDVHVVAVKNEVKEVLLISRNIETPEYRETSPAITAIDLSRPEQVFTFTREEERNTTHPPLEGELEEVFLYEPNAAVLKAGAYKLIADRFGLRKADVNTHLYFSDTLVPDFPGRVWRIVQCLNDKNAVKTVHGRSANIICRNYPLTPEQLKKKLHLRDGGTAYMIACRVAGKPVIYEAERV
ncbi:MAG: hypothetical protein J5902_03230 [Paludibacteraceae bacterium]|nr:hypothetical protein [Paludibacteraceae bacterium]